MKINEFKITSYITYMNENDMITYRFVHIRTNREYRINISDSLFREFRELNYNIEEYLLEDIKQRIKRDLIKISFSEFKNNN